MMQRAWTSMPRTRVSQMFSHAHYCSKTAEGSIKPPKQRGDSEFVKRRRLYGKDMHKLRIEFAAEAAETESQSREAKKVDQEGLEGVAEARAARKREKSIARQAEHLARLQAVQEKKKGRREYKRRDWEKRWGKVVEDRVAVADLLAEHAKDWVREETLDEHVERAIDDFFVVGAQQKRELEEMVE